MSEQPDGVADRQVELALEELGGRVEAPDRVGQILGRIATGATAEPAGVRPNHASRFWMAALLLLGLGATVAAALLASSDDDSAAAGRDEAVAGALPPPGLGAMRGPAEPHPEGLPQGTDPADIAAMRSADQMLAAEKKLQQLIDAGKIGGVDQVLPFEQLNSWPYTEGLAGMPEAVRSLDGKKVLMLGFMLPIDEVQDIAEFLLVESLWSCCYGEPPNIHGMVRCNLPSNQRLDYQFDPLKVVGTLHVRPTLEDGYVVDIYQLEVDYVEVVH